jgi:hypothetical protein
MGKRARSESEESETESGAGGRPPHMECIGTMDNGFMMHYVDVAYQSPVPPAFQSRSLFLVKNAHAASLERVLADEPRWRVVDNIDDATLLVQHVPTHTMYVSMGNTPAIASTTENVDPPHGAMWVHGTYPIDQQFVRRLYLDMWGVLGKYHGLAQERCSVSLVVSLCPMKIVALQWPIETRDAVTSDDLRVASEIESMPSEQQQRNAASEYVAKRGDTNEI